MLTIIFVIFIGKYYYELAQAYYKHRWLYFALGIGIYFFSIFLLVYTLGYSTKMGWLQYDFTTSNVFIIQFVFAPLCTLVIYAFLYFKWKKKEKMKIEINEIGERKF